MTLSESHVSQRYNEHLYDIDGYEFVNKPRQTGQGGGVAIYLKNSINWKRRTDFEHENIENISIEILTHKCKSFLIIALYRPPKDSKYLSKNF